MKMKHHGLRILTWLNFIVFRTYVHIRRIGRVSAGKVKFFFGNFYNNLKIYEIVFFFKFLFHRYSPQQFNPLIAPQNVKVLLGLYPGNGLNANRDGTLIRLKSRWDKTFFSMKNILLFGALQSRVEKVVYYTYLTLTLELNNPFTKKILEGFLEKKLRLLKRLLGYVKQINGKEWDHDLIRMHITVFERSSLFQAEVIRRMHLAVKRQKLKPIVLEAKVALEKGLYPVLATVGVSGSYWMRGSDRRILGLFKPFDEEVHAPHNPTGPKHRGALGLRRTRRGCRVGESPHHEVGAFVVDEFFGFGIVPKTYYASFTHHIFFSVRENRLSRKVDKTKYGSFQEFVSGFVSVDKLSLEEIASIPLDEFQLLVVLDVIIGNTDRNIGNILFGDEKIAAIDHGLTFSDALDDFSYWYWSYLKQGDKPLFQPIVDLLNNFPFDELGHKLQKKCFISPNALQRMRERVVLFTAAINDGLVPSQIEGIFTSHYLTPLLDRKETLLAAAKEQVKLFRETL